ncbi:hypothetical protein OHB41_50370 [Streptomyces sp. NBC_01571]|uniref:hypothetical protein n=1 Tax=Streptomyces sp. NBC_01571 TaxID=2975883 RepID=UPI00225147A5|nr:hypothetical protein [Streptomyces sp. NBC_01571]MCX4581168.1 hypothetical protein [Streptomyces sp. NBC_01571]
MTEITIRPEPRTTALTLIRATALDHVAPGSRDDEPPLPNRQMYDDLTSALQSWRAAGTLREDSLLLVEWLAVELCGYLHESLDQDNSRFDRWLRDFGDEVCQSQTHPHPAGPTAVEIMSVVADRLGPPSDSRTATEQLVRIGVPYLHYVRHDHDIEDAREIALTFALWAGQQLAELMHHDPDRVHGYVDSRLR